MANRVQAIEMRKVVLFNEIVDELWDSTCWMVFRPRLDVPPVSRSSAPIISWGYHGEYLDGV